MNSLRLALKPSLLRPLSSRCYSIASRSIVRPSWQAAKKFSYPSFSTSIARKEPVGDGDELLAAKFAQERSLELETVDPHEDSPKIKEFKANGVWEIIDRPGTEEILLQRTIGNETIKVQMSIISMTEFDEAEEFDMEEEDPALGDDDFEQPKRTINQSGARGGPVDVLPEDSIAPADREGGEVDDESRAPSFAIDLDITISKPDKRSIEISGRARDGAIEIDRLQYNPATPADDDTTTPYAGPPFNNLDADLIVMFDQYLEERGINAELANMLPALIEHKEQKEYVDWLGNMQNFIES